MKKLLAAIVACTLTAAMLAGCGSQGSDSSSADKDKDVNAQITQTDDGEESNAGAQDGADDAGSGAQTDGEGAAQVKTVKEGVLTMATNATFPPYEYYEGNEIIGIDVDIADAIAKKLGLELKIEDMEFNSIIIAVTQGKADIGLAGMTVMEERLDAVNFSDSYATGIQAIIVAKDSDIQGVDDLKGKKIAMTWAYSPSYGKPLSVPQGIIGLMSRFGMDVVLAHPEGYEIFPEVEAVAAENAKKSGGTFTKTNNMAEAFKDADIVYPKSWAPFAAMEKRTELYGNGDTEGIKALEKELLAQNAQHKDWACTEELMKTTKDGKALYMHCLPADITGVSCEEGEVDASVFDRYRNPLYKEASFKPYIIAAMIFLAKFADPADILKKLEEKSTPRVFK